jgi:hypothetical protein
MTEVEALVEMVEHARAELLRAVSDLNDTQGDFTPGDGIWSVTQNVEHLYLAELSGVTKIWMAADSARRGHIWTDPNPNRGKSIEAVIAATWKEKEVAPPIATPHVGGPLSFWIEATHALTPMLASVGQRLEGLLLDDVVFPHFLSGPMDARLRLEFLRFHIDRHHAQIARLRARPDFPA